MRAWRGPLVVGVVTAACALAALGLSAGAAPGGERRFEGLAGGGVATPFAAEDPPPSRLPRSRPRVECPADGRLVPASGASERNLAAGAAIRFARAWFAHDAEAAERAADPAFARPAARLAAGPPAPGRVFVRDEVIGLVRTEQGRLLENRCGNVLASVVAVQLRAARSELGVTVLAVRRAEGWRVFGVFD